MNRRTFGVSFLAPIAAAVCLTIPAVGSPSHSDLWGAAGERWIARGGPASRLPDFSFAGYHGGARALPNDLPVAGSVIEFGARPDDGQDDTQAFQKAIAAVDRGVLLIPAGMYEIRGQLRISKSHVVLRGEGTGPPTGTVLHFPKSPDALGAGWPDRQDRFVLFLADAAERELSRVTSEARRGDRVLEVESTAGLNPGQMISLVVHDDERHSFWEHLHDGQVAFAGQKHREDLEWPVQIASIEGRRITLGQPLRFDVRQAWTPMLTTYTPIEEVGVEHLELRCAGTPHYSHEGDAKTGEGWKALAFGKVMNGWAKDVVVRNAEDAITILEGSKWITVRDVAVRGYAGHHGLSVFHAFDNLFADFRVEAAMAHELGVSTQAAGNVFMDGGDGGVAREAFNLDHHRRAPFENLFTNIIARNVTADSGGSHDAGPHSAARSVFWNVAPGTGFAVDDEWWGAIQATVVGRLHGSLGGARRSKDGAWYEAVDRLQPRNLYLAQMQQAHRTN
jgi:hypothetical protein